SVVLSIYFGPVILCVTLSEPGNAWLSDAWTKFDRSESTTNILRYLQSVYKTKESCHDYICIDKGCQVLQTAITNGSWDTMWKKTSRFIVDTYYYINHQANDYLCRKYCNSSLGDGSALNLVMIAYDDNGNAYAQKAFNTQVCEQLNAWLGDGSAPNLVIIAYDDNGNAYAQKTFNTQVCEQLNAWLGGFESILKCMTPGNFNWFLCTMPF
ncbi:hypothetical protein CVT25_013582, partial [Psilocybe cyanescens]